MLTRSADTLQVLAHLRLTQAQCRTDLEQDMDQRQTDALRTEIRLLTRLIEEFSPPEG